MCAKSGNSLSIMGFLVVGWRTFEQRVVGSNPTRLIYSRKSGNFDTRQPSTCGLSACKAEGQPFAGGWLDSPYNYCNYKDSAAIRMPVSLSPPATIASPRRSNAIPRFNPQRPHPFRARGLVQPGLSALRAPPLLRCSQTSARPDSGSNALGYPLASSMTGRPSLVPGSLMSTFGRLARAHSSFAAAKVRAVSYARSGDTSNET